MTLKNSNFAITCSNIMSITLQLKQKAAALLNQQHEGHGFTADSLAVEPTAEGHVGDFTLLLFPLMRYKLGSPEAIGAQLGEALVKEMAEVAEFNVVKGFLNLTLTDTYWLGQLQRTLSDIEGFLKPNVGQGKRVLVEYSSPNTNKPLHLGHLRNNFLGYSVAELHKACGYDVVKANLVNDRGIHICKSMVAWQQYAFYETPEKAGMKGDHLVGKYYVRYEQEIQKQADELMKEWQKAMAQNNMAMFSLYSQSTQQALLNLTKNKTEDAASYHKALKDIARNETDLHQKTIKMLVDWEKGKKDVVELWKMMNSWVMEGFRETYARMGVDFDKFYYESETYLLGKKIVKEGMVKGLFYSREDGSVWVDLREEGLDEKLLLRRDSTSVYITQDLGTADLKFEEFKPERSIYVIGNEQDYHMKALISILKKLGREYANGMYHLSYGMVDLPTGRMKSREGTVVDADELMEEMHQAAKEETTKQGKTEGLSEAELSTLFETIGLGALKYFLLKVDPTKRMLFNPEESIALQGNTGPFIQYSHARISSLLLKADEPESTWSEIPQHLPVVAAERELIKTLERYPNALVDATEKYNPSLLANYLYELARDFNRFYYELPILKTDEREVMRLRLGLSKAVRDVLRFGLGLLGIHAPERM
jgi:arginyl-tRNA synthetase